MTKDERYLVEVYKSVKTPTECTSAKSITDKLGFKEKLTQNILRGLMQANLVKWCDADQICLTDRGVKVVQSLLQ